MKKDQELAAQRWNQEYVGGKYKGEEPVPFVNDILTTLKSNDKLRGNGLYVGCGNGRNYIPLIDSGLNLIGLDISPEALQQIETKRPDSCNKLICADFLDYKPSSPLDYIVSLQIFQHGSQAEIAKYFEKTARLLKTNGLFFLRVNSTATEIFHAHKIVETSPDGGRTVEYTDGPKAGMKIHFYTKKELGHLTESRFEPITELAEVVMSRKPPQTGRWVQWEGIWRKTD